MRAFPHRLRTRSNRSRAARFFPFALALAAASPALGAPAPRWAEGEAFYKQRGSRPPDRPPYASRGRCLGCGWGGRRGDYALYRFRIANDLPDAWLYIRYARRPAADAVYEIRLDGRVIRPRAAFPSTGGWGHQGRGEWAYRRVRLGELKPGRHALKFVSLAHKNNTNIDGFFIATGRFSPPNSRKEIEMAPRLDMDSDPNRPTPETVDESLSLADFQPTLPDWHYPASEPAERAQLVPVSLVEAGPAGAALRNERTGEAARAAVGEDAFGWRVMEILTEPEPLAVLEREFDEWGLLLFVGPRGAAAEFRKPVGRLDAMKEPVVRLPKNYYEQLLAAREDVLGEKVLAGGADPSFEKVAGYLPPLRAYTFVAALESEKKYIVRPDGSVGLWPLDWGSEKDLAEVFFDPASAVGDVEPTASKSGLLAGSLPAVVMGFYDAASGRGWEECVFAAYDGETKVFLRIRERGGRPSYYQLDPLRKLENGKAFYAGLLALRRYWDRVFEPGMKLEAPDARAVDAARAGLTLALAGCVGLHPKYGLGHYWGKQHDTFPPTTLSLCLALLDWGLHEEAKRRLGYYLDHFIKPDGSIDYYGPAVAEYGQFLALAAKCARQTRDWAWFDAHRGAVDRLCQWVLARRRESEAKHPPDTLFHGLICGSPEADTRKDVNFYFSGDCWCWRGLVELGRAYQEAAARRGDEALARRAKALLSEAAAYRSQILRAAEQSILEGGGHRFLPPIVGQKTVFGTMTENRLASYTNYRYWLEALSAECLGEKYDKMMMDYRAARGGELLGMTRFEDHLDDWPLHHYADALLRYDRVRRFLLTYYGHMAHHQTRGTFTAYEQVPIRGYRWRGYYADYCVPSELTIPLMTRWMLAWEVPDRGLLLLCRAAPREWVRKGFAFQGASTRWGRVSVRVAPRRGLRVVEAKLSFDGDLPPAVNLFLRHPDKAKLAGAEAEGADVVEITPEAEVVSLAPRSRSVSVHARFEP